MTLQSRDGVARPPILIQQATFGHWQPAYAEHGIATFPMHENKVPAIKGYAKIGIRGSHELTRNRRFADAPALGFVPGPRTRITVLDVDTGNKQVLRDALDLHGETPLIARTGSGNYHAYYRHNGEPRLVRPWKGLPIDLLGGGCVVAPPSLARYEFIQGGLDDLDRLPPMRRFASETKVTPAVTKGSRNEKLFRHCLRQARDCDDLSAMLDAARSINADRAAAARRRGC